MERPQKKYSALKENPAKKNLSITFCYACGYSFDLMLCKKIDVKVEKRVEEYNC